MEHRILQTSRKQLSSEFTIVWYWFDRADELPGFQFGTDENPARSGLYQNNKLISTVNWNERTVTLQMVLGFLKCASDYQKIPGVHHLPMEIT